MRARATPKNRGGGNATKTGFSPILSSVSLPSSRSAWPCRRPCWLWTGRGTDRSGLRPVAPWPRMGRTLELGAEMAGPFGGREPRTHRQTSCRRPSLSGKFFHPSVDHGPTVAGSADASPSRRYAPPIGPPPGLVDRNRRSVARDVAARLASGRHPAGDVYRTVLRDTNPPRTFDATERIRKENEFLASYLRAGEHHCKSFAYVVRTPRPFSRARKGLPP